jgi:hypothetical protein
VCPGQELNLDYSGPIRQGKCQHQNARTIKGFSPFSDRHGCGGWVLFSSLCGRTCQESAKNSLSHVGGQIQPGGRRRQRATASAQRSTRLDRCEPNDLCYFRQSSAGRNAAGSFGFSTCHAIYPRYMANERRPKCSRPDGAGRYEFQRSTGSPETSP